MNKQELVKGLSAKTGLTQVAINKVMVALEESIIETVKEGHKVQITGLLTIKPVYRAPRKGYDPLKLVAMDVPASVAISVKAGEKLASVAKGLNVEDFAPKEKEVVAE